MVSCNLKVGEANPWKRAIIFFFVKDVWGLWSPNDGRISERFKGCSPWTLQKILTAPHCISPPAVKWNLYRPLLTQLTQCVNRSSLFTFIEEIRNRKLHFLCIVYDSYNYMGSELILVLKFTSYIAVNSDIWWWYQPNCLPQVVKFRIFVWVN